MYLVKEPEGSKANVMEMCEQELLELLATDLYQHFYQLVLCYQQRLYAFARRLTGSAAEAEDIVQETLVSAYVSLENYPVQRILTLKLQAWLYRVTLNVYTHNTRRTQLQLVPLDMTEGGTALTIEARADERPDVLFEDGERRRELEGWIAQLPERYRIAVTCYYFECLSYQEIADLLEQPVGTVKSNISRGVRHLQKLLQTADTTELAPVENITALAITTKESNELWSIKRHKNKKA